MAPREDLGFAANFLYMLSGEEPTPLQVKALNHALVLHADHELNASTFAARVCASTLADIYSCVTTAIGTLKGPLHGGANERVFDMLTEIREMGDTKAYLKEKLDSQEKSWALVTVFIKHKTHVKNICVKWHKLLPKVLKTKCGSTCHVKLKIT